MSGQFTVLYVGEDEGFATALAGALEGKRGGQDVDVRVAESPEEGVDHLRDGIDCVVSERAFPEGDGVAFLRAVREERPGLPTVLAPIEGSRSVAARALSAAVSFYVPRRSDGMDADRIAERVDAALRASAGNSDANRDVVEDDREGTALDDRTVRRDATVVENTMDAISVVSPDGTVEFLSPASEAVVGYEPAELDGEDGFEYVHPGDRDELHDTLAALLEDDAETETVEYRFRRPDGDWSWIESRVTTVDDGIDGVLLSSRNVDGRKEREAAHLQQYETVVDHLGEAVLLLDPEGRVRVINDYLADALGVSKAAVEGKSVAALFEAGNVSVEDGPATAVETLVDLFASATAGDPVRDEVTVSIDGTEAVLDVKTVGMTGPEGEHLVVGTARNVTDRRQLETRLRLYEQVIEGSMDLFAAIDDDGRFLFANEAYCSYHGLDPDAVTGQDVEAVLDGELVERLEPHLERAFAGEEVHYEITRSHPELGDRYLDVRYYPVSGVDGSSRIVVAAMRDVTGRKRREERVTALHTAAAEIATAEQETAVYRTLIEAADDVLAFDFAIADAERDGVLVPQAMSESLARDEYYDETPVDDDSTFAARAFRQGETILANDLRDHDVAPADPEYRSVLTVPIARYGVFQAGSRAVGAFDETDRALTELLVGHAVETLTRKDRERRLRNRSEQLERENERLERFASVVSHDLRNPLTVASGELELARETCDSPHLSEIETSLDRMAAIIEDVLAMAREGRTVDADELASLDLETVAEDAWGQVATEGAELAVEAEPRFVADADRVRQVFENLFRNAIEHGRPDAADPREDGGSTLTVRVGTLPDGDGFYVEDDGVGIPEPDRDTVFEAGYTTAPDGTGFGLQIVEEVAEAHGWSVELTESKNGGARFEIRGVDRP